MGLLYEGFYKVSVLTVAHFCIIVIIRSLCIAQYQGCYNWTLIACVKLLYWRTVKYSVICEGIFYFPLCMQKIIWINRDDLSFIFFTLMNYIKMRFNNCLVSALNLEAADSLKIFLTIYQTFWHHQASRPESKNMWEIKRIFICSSFLMNLYSTHPLLVSSPKTARSATLHSYWSWQEDFHLVYS